VMLLFNVIEMVNFEVMVDGNLLCDEERRQIETVGSICIYF
jgi:hypothetical protein